MLPVKCCCRLTRTGMFLHSCINALYHSYISQSVPLCFHRLWPASLQIPPENCKLLLFIGLLWKIIDLPSKLWIECSHSRLLKFLMMLGVELTSCCVYLLKRRVSFSSSCTSRQKAASTRWRSWCTTIPQWPTASSPRCTTRRRSATSPPSTESLPTMTSGRWSALTLP